MFLSEVLGKDSGLVFLSCSLSSQSVLHRVLYMMDPLSLGKKRKEARRCSFLKVVRKRKKETLDVTVEDDYNSVEYCSECSSSFVSDESLYSDSSPDRSCCDNCKRAVPLFAVTSGVAFHKLFAYVKKPRGLVWEVYLCTECKGYLTESNVGFAWPAFVWLLLSDSSLMVRQKMWSILPRQWRCWWKLAVVTYYPSMNLDVLNVSVDVTSLYELHRDCLSIDAMQSTSWLSFVDCCENTMTFPQVRCPWGCGVPVGNTNAIPFDFCGSEVYSKADWYVHERGEKQRKM